MNFLKTFLKNNLLYILKEERIGMIFLILAWTFLIVFIIAEGIKNKKQTLVEKNKILRFQLLLLIFMFLYSVIGIAIKDPLSDLICGWIGICIPAVVEWVVYIGILGYLVWKFILLDMKTNITTLQRENKNISERLGKVEGNVEIIKENTNKIMQKCLHTPDCK